MSSAASRMMPTLRRVVLAGAVADRSDGQLLGAFVADRDADAFAGLVRRHGPMVLGVCRRVTGDSHAAEDAFQAVFVVLARRASAVKPREQVGNWLYGVAYRTAIKARAVLARRRSREKQVDVMPERPATHQTAAAEWADLQTVIDEELARLPDKLRLPVVLCDLEGRPQRDVAKHLGIPPATLATRLASARRTLATRLTKRGVALSGGALAGLLSTHGTATAVPVALAHGVARAAEMVAEGGVVSSLVSAHAVQLSEGVMRMMLLSKLKAVAVAALTAVALTGGLGLGLVPAYARAGDEPKADTTPTAAPATNPPAKPTNVDDATFLRRLTLDFRGTPPTDVEAVFFAADDDANKRDKIVVWLTDDGDVRAFLAKKFGVPAERVRLIRASNGRLVVVVEAEPTKKDVAVKLTLNTDGRLAGTITDQPVKVNLNVANGLYTGRRQQRVVMNEVYLDTLADPTAGYVGWFFDGQQAKPTNSVWVLDSSGSVRFLDAVTGEAVANPPAPDSLWIDEVQTYLSFTASESDVDFLKRVIQDARGAAPTALEEKYFAEDKDPKKREKLLDALLKDPAVAKKLGDDWKKKMLDAASNATKQGTTWYFETPRTYNYVLPSQNHLKWNVYVDGSVKLQADKHTKLIDDLLAAKKSDAEMLEAVTLAVASRLPTDAEKKLTLGLVAKAADRKAAWLEVAKALAASK